MLLLRPVRKLQGRSKVHLADPSSIHFHSALEFDHSNTRRHVRLLGPCFKTGRLRLFYQHPKGSVARDHCLAAPCVPRSAVGHPVPGYNTHPKASHVPCTLLPDFKPMLACQRTANTPVRAECRPSKSNLNRFPSSNFTYCFILFPKCFSSFPHGTCSLSVSRQYLALDGIYHPIRAAFPNNSTLGKHTTMRTVVLGTNGIVTLIDAVFQPTYPRSDADVASRDYNSDPERARFQS
jgi:hypothetical protein